MKALFKRFIMVLLLMGFSHLVYAQAALTSVFYSGIDQSSDLSVLYNSVGEDQVLVHRNSTISAMDSDPYILEGWNTTSIPTDIHPYIGFKNTSDGILLNPIYWQELDLDNLGKLSPMCTDPSGDQNFSNINLDITAVYVGFSATQVHFAIQNSGNGFPISSGFTYFSYMAIMVNPEANPEDNPPVYGLMHTVNLAGVISPGLYKIVGTGFGNLSRIGDIQTQIDATNNLLYLSCNLSDLYADTDFMAWFDPEYPLVGSMAISSKITLTGGIQEADSSPAANLLLKPREVQIDNLHSPVLSNTQFEAVDGIANIGIDYYDADANFPLVHKVFIDDTEIGDLIPNSPLDFSSEQGFFYENLILPQQWDQIQLRFSDNGIDYVSETILNNTDAIDYLAPPATFSLYPNPAQTSINLKQSAPKAKSPVTIELFNHRGQLLRRIQAYKSEIDQSYSIDLRDLGSGVYFIRSDGTQKRFVIVR